METEVKRVKAQVIEKEATHRDLAVAHAKYSNSAILLLSVFPEFFANELFTKNYQTLTSAHMKAANLHAKARGQ